MPILTLTVVAASYPNQRGVFVLFEQMHALNRVIILMRKIQPIQTIFPHDCDAKFKYTMLLNYEIFTWRMGVKQFQYTSLNELLNVKAK
jgi:hypothetical protein